MPRVGLEPTQYCYRGILNPVRLPVSPPWLINFNLLPEVEINLVCPRGVEPLTARFVVWYSIQLSYGHIIFCITKKEYKRIFFKNIWWRGRDSNPCAPFRELSLSRRALLTTQSPLHNRYFHINLTRIE